MTVWIVTTGSSDIQLKNTDNWNHLYTKYRKKLNVANLQKPEVSRSEEYAKAPAKVLGVMYAEEPEYYQDLAFPLLDAFSKKLEPDKPAKIFVLLSNQEDIFTQIDKRLENCPYWKDTCTLQPLFEKYLTEKFPKAKQEYLELNPPTGTKGLDHWNDTLSLVEKTLSGLPVDWKETIYVSHQAGTPAISSAVQFVTLGRFGRRVRFLVGNEYEQSEAEIIESSTYLRGIQIQQAKGFIQENAPGAALKLLEKLEGIDSQAIANLQAVVDVFNLNRPLLDTEQELEIKPATQRIVDALDLIGIFFSQKNYLSGITLLAAAQETFLKVAILSKVEKITATVDLNGRAVQVYKLVEWTPRGLMFSKELRAASSEEWSNFASQVKLPNDRFREFSSNEREIGNSWMLSWLYKLEPRFQAWKLLKWSCWEKDRKGEHEADVRNQFLHNLCGVEEKDVVKYLLGNEWEEMTAIAAYTDRVKEPFRAAINQLGIHYNRENLRENLKKLAELIQ